jgi:hypothetical protein
MVEMSGWRKDLPIREAFGTFGQIPAACNDHNGHEELEISFHTTRTIKIPPNRVLLP